MTWKIKKNGGNGREMLYGRGDAHRELFAFKAIMTLPQLTAFAELLKGHEGECPFCRRSFADA